LRNSLLGRLVVRVLAVTVFFIAVSLAGILIQFLEQVDTLRDRDLSGQARDIASHLSHDPASAEILFDLPERLRAAYDASGGMYLYAVLDPEGNNLFGSIGLDSAIASGPDVLTKTREPFRVSRVVGGASAVFYGITIPVPLGDAIYFVQVAQGPNHDDALADEFLSELWEAAGWYIAGLVILLVGVVYLTVRSSLRPVNEVSRQAAAISPSNMDVRLGSENLPRELEPLVDGMNNALARIEHAYHAQRVFTDDAAHELRTPIATLRAHVETRGYGAALLEDVARLERIVEQLLRLARADNFMLHKDARADLNDVVRQVMEMLAPEAVQRDVDIELDAPEGAVTVFGEDGFLFIALRNVVENAFNAAGPGGRVLVTVGADAQVMVDDAGPGIPRTERERMFERFWRADKSGEKGAGLGLSIVQRIVDVHGGRCEVDDSPLGGLRFRICLRAAGKRG